MYRVRTSLRTLILFLFYAGDFIQKRNKKIDNDFSTNRFLHSF